MLVTQPSTNSRRHCTDEGPDLTKVCCVQRPVVIRNIDQWFLEVWFGTARDHRIK